MGYICPHGLLYAQCYECATITEAIEQKGYVLLEEDRPEDMYDYWLDQDERNLRDDEEDNG